MSSKSYPITPLKSEGDKREYRVVKLKNDLEAILISDPETDKAGAALDVHVGHFSDPDELPGLAHFLEHMLFMGTKKFPDENIYSALISEHGGRSNAYTSTENTNYYFDVVPEKLETILEVFAGFFTEPLFTPSATEREMKAVHSENAQNLLNDSWRQFQLLKSTSNPAHPFSKFGTGNLTTLLETPKSKGIDTRAELLKFHKKYYSANIMKLCVLGKESLDDLEKLAVKHFSDVANQNLDVPVWPADPFGEKTSLGCVYEVVPIKDLRRLDIMWATPPVREHYKKKPSSLLGHLFGHESGGSVLSVLKKRGWANELSAGLNQDVTSFSSFAISVDLTPAGLETWKQIVKLVYQYVNLILTASEAQWKQTFAECRDVAAMNFRFKGKESPFSYCSSTAGKLHKYAPEDILAGPWKYEQLDVKLVKEIVKKMTPDNMRIHLVSPSFKGKTELKEEWYTTEYNKTRIEAKDASQWREPGEAKDLHLPKPNIFIATNFDLVQEVKEKREKETEKTFPSKILDECGFVAWHKTDDVFFKPKGNVFISLDLPHFLSSPRAYVLGDLFRQATEESLSEYAYDAEIASLSYSLSLTKKGLQLKVGGYTHKLHLLLYKVVERIKTLTVEDAVFERLKERTVRDYANFFRQQPYRHALYNQNRALTSNKWKIHDQIEEIKTIKIGDLREFAKSALDYADVECLVFGNFTEEKSKEIVVKIKGLLNTKPLSPSLRSNIRAVKLNPGTTYSLQREGFNPDDVNSCVCVLYQVGEENYPKLAALSMVGHLIREPAFDQLRTKEQLGYTVFSVPSDIYGALCLLIIVQSPTKGAKYLDSRVEAFLAKYREEIVKMDGKTFSSNLDALIKKKLEKDKTMAQEAKRHWDQVLYKQYKFNKAALEVEDLRKLTKEAVLSFYDRYIGISKTRSKFSTQVFGKDTPIPSKAEEGAKEEAKMKMDEAKKEDGTIAPVKPAETLPPVPEDTATQVEVRDADEFVRSMTLFPAFFR